MTLNIPKNFLVNRQQRLDSEMLYMKLRLEMKRGSGGRLYTEAAKPAAISKPWRWASAS
jgi:hypothetical protein